MQSCDYSSVCWWDEWGTRTNLIYLSTIIPYSLTTITFRRAVNYGLFQIPFWFNFMCVMIILQKKMFRFLDHCTLGLVLSIHIIWQTHVQHGNSVQSQSLLKNLLKVNSSSTTLSCGRTNKPNNSLKLKYFLSVKLLSVEVSSWNASRKWISIGPHGRMGFP